MVRVHLMGFSDITYQIMQIRQLMNWFACRLELNKMMFCVNVIKFQNRDFQEIVLCPGINPGDVILR